LVYEDHKQNTTEKYYFRKNYVHTMMMDRYKQTENDFNTTCNTSNVS